MIIRRGRSEDAPALTALILASKRSNGYDDVFMAACMDELRVSEKDLIDQTYWIAQIVEPVGCVGLGMQADHGIIHDFFIHPDHKRKGIGRALWNVVLDAAQQNNLTQFSLDADPAAVAFYEALGFKITRKAPSGSIPGRMLPHMQLVLRP